MSRKTFYKWLERYRTEGVDGHCGALAMPVALSRSRHLSRSRTGSWASAKSSLMPVSIMGRPRSSGIMGQARLPAVPAVSTIHRIMVRRGLVSRSATQATEGLVASVRGACAERVVADRCDGLDDRQRLVKVFNIIDDHSRVAIRSRAVLDDTGENAWTTFNQGASRVGAARRCPVGQRAVLLRQTARAARCSSKPACATPGFDPSPGEPYPPADHRQSRTLPTDLEEVAAASNPSPPTSPSSKPNSTSSARSTTTNAPTKASERVTPICRWQANPPAHQQPAPLDHPTLAKTVRSHDQHHRRAPTACSALTKTRHRSRRRIQPDARHRHRR